jgi:hypothetical protein
LPAASPQISMHMADIVENRDGDEVMIQEDDFVNWDGSMVPTPESPQESNQWCVESNTSVPCPPTTSPHIVATPVKANNGHARHPGPARQAVFAAARQFLIRYIKYYVTPCTRERWCKAYNQPRLRVSADSRTLW